MPRNLARNTPNNTLELTTSMNSTTDIVGWTPEPRGRGTIGLLWSCFATIFLCTWNAIHPNLPALNESKFKIVGRRIRYILLCLLAPEWVASIAMNDLADAIYIRKAAKAEVTNLNWSLKQSFFLAMGGFVVQNDSAADAEARRVRPKKLLELFKSKAMPWPNLSDAELNDRSKADWIVKSLAVLQILWFTTQLIGRWAQGLAVTTLELFTIGIVFCGSVTYVANWEKPFDVQVPVVLQTKTSIRGKDFTSRVEFDAGGNLDYEYNWVNPGIIALCLGFGAIHIGGWNFHFPSVTEQLLWRISSVACAVLPFMILLALYTEKYLSETIYELLFGVLMVLYFLSRIYMFVEMFVSLRAVPASVYQTPQWSQYFPSLG